MTIDKFLFKKHLEKGEKIKYAVHKHGIAILKPTLEVAFFGLGLPWALYFVGLSTNIFFWLAIVWSFIALIRFIYVLVDWYSDAWLITNMSVITIEWNGIFSNNAARLGYEDVEGASYEIKGFWGTMLRFGDLQLRVMSGTHVDLGGAARPKKAELALLRAQEEYLGHKNWQDTTSLKSLLSSMVAHHNRSDH